ncbi:TonB-dependent receptor [Prolixibacteraceae bacterium Z1-6]|uniref:TonB-dependent receptor n=1 Tax=Draconibacterium aestuarii TaxID=2998507 RepID=A0A9X3J794_9BACT|nr:TonB-dependent receptor [Prolixibacteraceae bacterium Z1-6]
MKKNVSSTFLKRKVLRFLVMMKVVWVFILVSVIEAGAIDIEKASHLTDLPGSPVSEKMVEQQEKTITGNVTDGKGLPMPGVTVLVKGTTTGTVTDVNGNFSLEIPSTAEIIQFSFVGMKTKDVTLGEINSFNIVLEEETTGLDEVVVVGYGSQKKESVTGAVSSVDTDVLKQSSSPNLSVALAGQMPGLTVMQSSGQPGRDDVNLYLRGIGTLNNASPLILIDGVPRDNMNKLDPNEVASVSILKDASATAVFGVRGANGVILITTRRGEKGKSELNVSVDRTYQQFTVQNDRIHSWEFAELRNEAFANSNPDAAPEDYPFTQYMIDKYRSGEDPIFYPDRDVYHDYFRDWAPQTRVNTNFNGGGESFTYFLNAGYIGQGGNFYTEPESELGYDPSYSMDRYNFRGNIDFNITNNLKASLNLGTYLQKMNSPQTAELYGSMANLVQNMMAYSWATPPTAPGPLTIPGYGVPENEIVAQPGWDQSTYGGINRRGYRDETSTVLNSSLALDWGLDFITKGLSAKGMIAFDSHANTVRQGSRGHDTYAVMIARDASETSGYSAIRNNTDGSIRLAKNMGSYYYMNYQASLNYARSFGKHSVTGMALYQRDNWDSWNADLPYNVIGYVGRVTYGYDNRYLAELNYGYNGSEQFAPDNRFGSFPAYSLGWVASNEAFLKDNKIFTHLKFRASYGIVGNDKLGNSRFLYQSFITMGGGEIPGLGYGQSVQQGRMGNEAIQWEKAEKKNIAFDLKLFEDFSLTVDLYNEYRDKILIGRSTIPVLQGVPLGNIPKVNIGIVENKGYEIELGYQKVINKDLYVGVRGNFNYNENKVEFADEVKYGDDYAYPYRTTGFSIGQYFGYQIDYSNGNGYINTQEELDNLPTYEVGGTPRLGDLKYVDVTEDGVINDRDLVPIGYSAVPRISYGISGNASYKAFDMSFVFAGMQQTSVAHTGWGVTEFGLVGVFSEWHKQAWTPERYAKGEEILYPALAMSPGVSQKANSLFIMDRSFLRLKNIEIGYSLPKKILNPIGIEGVRVYANGNNLLTWDKFPTNTIDPEQNDALAYPITKMLTFGVNVTF